MNDKLVIASSLADNELAKAFSQVVAERWDNFDITPFMAYLVDSCAPSILPYLAEQFDITGLQGLEMAENEEQQRELIKRSIALHKFIGTPWAIREACKTVGFPVTFFEEGVPSSPASQDTDWARFRILIQADDSKSITREHTRKLRLFIEYYKNERSHLAEFGYYQEISDRVFKNTLENRDRLHIQIPMFFSYSEKICVDESFKVNLIRYCSEKESVNVNDSFHTSCSVRNVEKESINVDDYFNLYTNRAVWHVDTVHPSENMQIN
jgi:P2-related tail formation protein